MDTNKNYTDEFLSSKRLVGDIPADNFIQQEFRDAEAKEKLQEWLNGLADNLALCKVPECYFEQIIISQCQQLPEWADNNMMKSGSAFFVRYAEQIMQLLGLLSLPYCYAAADGAFVLYISQRLQNDGRKRLLDTANFIWDVMAPNAFEKEGKGFASILKVRITHAAARYYTEKNLNWNIDFGLPLNQEDMAGTNLSFSLIVIRGLRKLGLTISYTDQEAFLHLWNVIGSLLGIHDDLIAHTGKQSNHLEFAIRQRHIKPSLHGQLLTQSLINTFSSNQKSKISAKETSQLMRYLLGTEIADILNLPNTSVPLYLPYILKATTNFPDLKISSNIHQAYQQKFLAFREQI